MPNNLLSVREVAALAGVRPETIYAYLHRGKMPPPDLTISRSPVWKRRTIERWLKTRAPRKRTEVRTTLTYRRIGPAGHYESTVVISGKPTRIAIVMHPGNRAEWDWLAEDLGSGRILAGGEVSSLLRAKQRVQTGSTCKGSQAPSDECRRTRATIRSCPARAAASVA